MVGLSRFWRENRLALAYGVAWSFIVLGLFLAVIYFDGGTLTPSDKKGFLTWPELYLVILLATLPSAMLVTHLMRQRLNGLGFSAALWRGPLSLLLGTALFGLLFGQLMTGLGLISGEVSTLTWLASLAATLYFPIVAFTVAPITLCLLPLACWNTWDLWRRVNQPSYTKTLL